ncbi:unnamed protein product [Strongylus vulgaris]|uniref:Uncharacterized protein n=1 Tax=Strongylus vulgaris TaxID=40348 RepID=A0A3P7IRM7_STRVU|nr:unnamed protein product [Strongylus vulgaris]
MRVAKQQQQQQQQQRRQVPVVPVQRPDFDECTFNELDKALYEDLHTALCRLSEEEFDIWEVLEKILHDYRNALGKFGTEAPSEEQRHASDAYRCICACVIENTILQEYDRGGDSFLSSLLADDRDFRLVYALWRWCIDSAIEPSGFADLARQVENIKELAGVAK